jgi:hypothetical protein
VAFPACVPPRGLPDDNGPVGRALLNPRPLAVVGLVAPPASREKDGAMKRGKTSVQRRRHLMSTLLSATVVAAAIMWIRSHYVSDDLTPSKHLLVQSQSGRLFFAQWRNEVVYVPDPSEWEEIHRDAPLKWNWAQFQYLTWRQNPQADIGFVIVVPYWALCLLLGIAAIAGPWGRHYRRRFRRRIGTCQMCGYDLRESPLRCPECGTPRAGNAL